MFPIDCSEEVARILYAPSMFHDGQLSMEAFRLTIKKDGKDEGYVSVWRTAKRSPKKRKKAKKYTKPRVEGDELVGFATLFVKQIEALEEGSCKSKVWSEKNDPDYYHVGIYYYLNEEQIKGLNDDPDYLLLTKELSLIARPTIYENV